MKEPLISNFAEKAYSEPSGEEVKKNSSQPVVTELEESMSDTPISPMTFTELENKDYQLPPISLLKFPEKRIKANEYQLIHANAAKLERTFQSFGVKAKVTQVHLGPAVTKYEVHPMWE